MKHLNDSNEISVSVDLGGTSIRAALIRQHLPISAVAVRPTPAKAPMNEVLEVLKQTINQVITAQVTRIDIAVPAVVDTQRGIVYAAANIPSWIEVPLKEIIETEYGIPAFIDNDVNCFTLGVTSQGEGQPFQSVVGITIGTGLGCALAIDGKIWHGANAIAGEIGSAPYISSDYEHYTSSLLFSRHTHLTGMELARRADNGETVAINLFKELGFHLGKLLQLIMYTYDPHAVIIGGGLAHAHPLYENEMRASFMDGFPYKQQAEKLFIAFSQLEYANLIGASLL